MLLGQALFLAEPSPLPSDLFILIFTRSYNILGDSTISSVPAFVPIWTLLAWIRTRKEEERAWGKFENSDVGMDRLAP